jgi:hypothetical protein
MQRLYKFLFSEVYETRLGEVFLYGSWPAGTAIISALWINRFAPRATERPLTTVFAVFGTLTALAVWLLTYLECMEWLAPWEDRKAGRRKPWTSPWRIGTSFFALVGADLLFYFGPSAAIASVRRGYDRNLQSVLEVKSGDAAVFWLFFALIIAMMCLQKAFALVELSEVEKRFPQHRLAKYAFILIVAIVAFFMQISASVPGLAFAFMPALLGWYGTTAGPLESLTNQQPDLRKALPRLLWICISHWVGWFAFWAGVMYVILAYWPHPPI